MTVPYVDKPGQLLKITIAQAFAQKQVQECNWHLMASVTGGQDSRAAVGAKVNELFEALISPSMSATSTFLGTRVAVIDPVTPYSPVIVRAADHGGRSEILLPTQCRICISLKTDLAGRKFRGRVYGFTPTSNDITADSHPTSSYVQKWESFMDNFRVSLLELGTTWNLVIYHRVKIPKPYVDPTLVTAVKGQLLFATQRRGGDYGRENIDPW